MQCYRRYTGCQWHTDRADATGGRVARNSTKPGLLDDVQSWPDQVAAPCLMLSRWPGAGIAASTVRCQWSAVANWWPAVTR